MIVMSVVIMALAAPSALAETHAWGWRGDGSGRFPDADPLVKWGRISHTLKGLSAQAEKPKAAVSDNSARPVLYGTVDEWLVLGPLYAKEGSVKELLGKELVPGEAALRPDTGEKVGEVAWRKVPSNGALLDLNEHFPDLKDKAVFAHSYIHSKSGGKVFVRFKGSPCRILLNGKEILRREKDFGGFFQCEVEFSPGWNGLLVKLLACRNEDSSFNLVPSTTFISMVLYGSGKGNEYESQGILWSVRPPRAGPYMSCAQPLVVGDRVFVNTDHEFLTCYDKFTGKRLWTSFSGRIKATANGQVRYHAGVLAAGEGVRNVAS